MNMNDTNALGAADRAIVEQALGTLRVPMIGAPMFLISGPEFVMACISAGIGGTLPAANCRTIDDLHHWLKRIGDEVAAMPQSRWAPKWGVNLVMHRTNPRIEEEIAAIVEHRVPLVVASVGAPDAAIGPVHSYGGKVLCDVVSLRHARRAIDAGVDGLILLTSGAGGHEGSANPMAFVRSVRQFYDGPLVLAGCIADGWAMAAARVLGADAVYVGTSLMVASESLASEELREMMLSCNLDDIMRTNALTGMYANFMRPSFVQAGVDPDNLPSGPGIDLADILERDLQKKRWKDIWSAGQGVGIVDRKASIAEIVARFEAQYRSAWEQAVFVDR